MLQYTPPCQECEGSCCKYVAIEIDKPTCKKDYDHIRWYLLHENVNVFIDHDNGWYVEFRTSCTEQLDDFQCGIYDKRPKICRSHGNIEGECEYYAYPYKKYFSSAGQFQRYLSRKGIDWRFKNLK